MKEVFRLCFNCGHELPTSALKPTIFIWRFALVQYTCKDKAACQERVTLALR